MSILIAAVISTSSIFGSWGSGEQVAKPLRSIVDTGGGGTSIGWRDAGDDGPGPRWVGGQLVF